MNGTLDIFCLDCHRFVEWRKVEFYRDRYFNWRIEVSCGCGVLDDPELHEIARAEHDLQVDVELETLYRNALDAALSRSGNLYFDILAWRGSRL